MLSTYQATLPPNGIIAVRKAAGALSADETRENGLRECRIYFPGSSIVLRLEGEDDPLARLAKGPTGEMLLKALEDNAWFPSLAQRLEPILTAGAPRGAGEVSGIALFGLNPLHETALRQDLAEIAPSLVDAPRVEVMKGVDEVAVFIEAPDVAGIDDILHGAPGASLQRVLHEHTGYAVNAWRNDFALDLDSVHRGLMSGGNNAPGMDLDWPEGVESPIPRYKVPIGR